MWLRLHDDRYHGLVIARLQRLWELELYTEVVKL